MIGQEKIIFSKKLENIYRENNIQLLCTSLFSQVKAISYFAYHHFYDDGRIFSACSSPEYIKHYYKEGVYVTPNELDELVQNYGAQKKLYGFFSKEIAVTNSLYSKNKHIQNINLGERFGLEKRFYIIKKEKDYFSLVGIGSNQVDKIQDFICLCIENKQIFNSFIDFFKEEGAKPINALKEEMITSPYKLERKQENKKTHYYDFRTGNEFSLSAREHECLESVILGRSMRNIADSLNLSSRTVETHIKNIKRKAGFDTKDQLVSFFQNLR
jgi:DNA-binding CsgD family transcriptional regulator